MKQWNYVEQSLAIQQIIFGISSFFPIDRKNHGCFLDVQMVDVFIDGVYVIMKITVATVVMKIFMVYAKEEINL
jgi:hypothetical protein